VFSVSNIIFLKN